MVDYLAVWVLRSSAETLEALVWREEAQVVVVVVEKEVEASVEVAPP